MFERQALQPEPKRWGYKLQPFTRPDGFYVNGSIFLLWPQAFNLPALTSHNKAHLPTKICLTCGRPFAYRKKWRNSWDEVKYCGEKCQRNRPKSPSDSLPKA